MKKWQRYWLYFLMVYAGVHLLRDVFQDLGIENWLSMILAKQLPSKIPAFWMRVYWLSFNTYIAAILEIMLAIVCLKRNSFGKLGQLTILTAVIIVAVWAFYWFSL